MERRFAVLWVLPAVLAAVLAGCSGGGADPAKGTSSDSGAKNGATVKDAGKAADDLSGLKELDEADRKLAEQQKRCPISDELLGSMGKPYKMTVKGRVVFLCCPGCEEKVTKDPDGTLKALDALLAKK